MFAIGATPGRCKDVWISLDRITIAFDYYYLDRVRFFWSISDWVFVSFHSSVEKALADTELIRCESDAICDSRIPNENVLSV